jgi:hypothetical protein
MKNKLEQVFWKGGKFVNTKGKEVDPKQIGQSHVVRLNFPFSGEEILKKSEDIILKKNYSSEINSYIICGGVEACYLFITEPCLIDVSIDFCKI